MEIIFDIGGTQTRVAKVKNAMEFSEPVLYPTPKTYKEGISTLISTIYTLASGESVQKIVGGFPGTITIAKQILDAPNLPLWVQKPFILDLQNAFQEATIYLENDAAMVGLGEALKGSGIGFEVVAYVTVSTGVGGARIVNGEIDRVAQGFEIGKQMLEPYQENLESLIGGHSLETKLGKKAETITDKTFWDDKAKILATGLEAVVRKWNPDAIVVGGPMLNDVGIDILKVEEYLALQLGFVPVIKKAILKSFGGLEGSLAYLQHKK
jgi:glucokinase